MCAFDLPDGATRGAVIQRAFDDGLIALGCGTRTVRFRPALTISQADLDQGLDILDGASRRRWRARCHPHGHGWSRPRCWQRRRRCCQRWWRAPPSALVCGRACWQRCRSCCWPCWRPRRRWARTGYEVAVSVGVALTALAVGGAAALQTGGAAPSVMRATMGAVVLQVWPVAVLSVMITVLAVRQAFVGTSAVVADFGPSPTSVRRRLR